MTDITQTTEPEQPYGPGGICDNCGHFAGRHDEAGCAGVNPDLGCRFGMKGKRQGTAEHPIRCEVFVWRGVPWPRPWLPAPDGLVSR